MQQVKIKSEWGSTEQKQFSLRVDRRPTVADRGESLAAIAHDARNMVAALDLYCDLLHEPGVLAAPFTHYSGELRLVAAASRRLLEKLATVGSAGTLAHAETSKNRVNTGLWPVSDQNTKPKQWKSVPDEPIENLAEELFANRSLLAALAGPTIALTVDAKGGAVPVCMSSEDLTRILINLVKNSAEAMSAVGRIHISLWENRGNNNTPWIMLNVEDNGPGLPESVLAKIFEPRLSFPPSQDPFAFGQWPAPHRGLGLFIIRSMVEAAGGIIHAENRDPVGTCFHIELPVQTA